MTDSTMTWHKPSVGDVWLAYVEFADHPGIGKVRPVIVLDIQDGRCLVIAAKVTSKDLRADGSGKCLPILDWQECGLRKPSFVRIDQVFELSYEKLLREAPIGRVNRAYVQVITSYLEF